jgi:hypothetical protein
LRRRSHKETSFGNAFLHPIRAVVFEKSCNAIRGRDLSIRASGPYELPMLTFGRSGGLSPFCPSLHRALDSFRIHLTTLNKRTTRKLGKFRPIGVFVATTLRLLGFWAALSFSKLALGFKQLHS